MRNTLTIYFTQGYIAAKCTFAVFYKGYIPSVAFSKGGQTCLIFHTDSVFSFL